MDPISNLDGLPVQPASSQAARPDETITLVNGGISHQARVQELPPTGEAWDPNASPIQEKSDFLVRCVVFRNEVMAVFDGAPSTPPGGEKRDVIKGASRESLNRLFLRANNTDVQFRTLSTITVHQDLWPLMPPKDVKYAHQMFIQECQRQGMGKSYLWVREHQFNGAPHFHNVHPEECEKSYLSVNHKGIGVWVDKALSRHLSIWFTEAIGRKLTHLCPHAGKDFIHEALEGCFICECLRKMAYPRSSKDGFLGCVRVESLLDQNNVAGYFSKEFAKRFQKDPPELWQNAGRWWGHSRDVVPKPSGMVYLPASSLAAVDIEHEGRTLRVVQKLQYGLGKALQEKSSVVEPLDDRCRKALENMGIKDANHF